MGEGSVAGVGGAGRAMNADTISIIISVVAVGVAVGALSMAGFRQFEDM